LASYLALRTDEQLELVRLQLDRMCAEAHRHGLGPEKVVIDLKRVWAELPIVRRDPGGNDALDGLYDKVLAASLDAYFAKSPVRPSLRRR
jgi:hypothetical protein